MKPYCAAAVRRKKRPNTDEAGSWSKGRLFPATISIQIPNSVTSQEFSDRTSAGRRDRTLADAFRYARDIAIFVDRQTMLVSFAIFQGKGLATHPTAEGLFREHRGRLHQEFASESYKNKTKLWLNSCQHKIVGSPLTISIRQEIYCSVNVSTLSMTCRGRRHKSRRSTSGSAKLSSLLVVRSVLAPRTGFSTSATLSNFTEKSF